MRWPLPAVLAWAASWAVFAALLRSGADGGVALGIACTLSGAAGLQGDRWWRRAMIGLGFPLSLAASGAVVLPAWAWLLALLLLLLMYPLNVWRDAPLFPTPAGALQDLGLHAPLAAGSLILDAGCGLGDGLKALRQAYPQAQWHGLEWSWPLRALCAWRCPWARVRQGDIWQADWSGYDLVYVFQRPESMARAAAKAQAELKAGAWLVSLAFEATALVPHDCWQASGSRRTIWIYRFQGPGSTASNGG